MLRQQLSQESFYFWNNWNIWRLSRLPPKWVSITANASGQCLCSGTAKGLHQSWPSGKSPSTEVLHRGWGCGAAVPWSGWHTSVSQALHPASLALLKSSDTATNPALGAGNYCGHGADKDAMLYLAHRKPGLTCSKDTFAPWQLGAGQRVSVPVESRSSFPEHWPMDTMPLGAQAVLVEGLGLEVTITLQEVSDGVCRLAIALLFAVCYWDKMHVYSSSHYQNLALSLPGIWSVPLLDLQSCSTLPNTWLFAQPSMVLPNCLWQPVL